MDAAPSISELFPNTAATNKAKSQGELGQEDFMRLMVAQLQNQDPTKPMDNFEFLSQIAQFGTVDGIQGLQQSFSDLASLMNSNQTLQAAGLVGHKVVTQSNLGLLEQDQTLDATVDLPQGSPAVYLYIQDISGRLVHTRTLGAAAAGEIDVQWDGTMDNGDSAPPGQYRVSAEAVIEGQTQGVSTYVHSMVQSVTIDPTGAGVKLNLAGGDQVSLGQVKSIL